MPKAEFSSSRPGRSAHWKYALAAFLALVVFISKVFLYVAPRLTDSSVAAVHFWPVFASMKSLTRRVSKTKACRRDLIVLARSSDLAATEEVTKLGQKFRAAATTRPFWSWLQNSPWEEVSV